MIDNRKFRVWSNNLNIFGYPCRDEKTNENDKTFTLGDTFILFEKDQSQTVLSSKKESLDCIVKKSDEYIITQFIGIKDNDGKDIFEGDILLINDKHYIVKYYPFWASFAFERINDDLDVIIGRELFWCRVIGNIFENLEK